MTAVEEKQTEPWQTVELDDETIERLRRLLFPQHADEQTPARD